MSELEWVRDATGVGGWSREGGGSSAYGTSYLGSFGATAGDLAAGNNVYAFDFPADAVLGSDVTISGDGKTFTIVTAGWYQLMVGHELSPPDNTSKGASLVSVTTTGLDAADLLALMDGSWFSGLVVDGAVIVANAFDVLTLASNFKAGDTFGLNINGTHISGTAPKVSLNMAIVRTA